MGFHGLRVVAFESRRAAEMAELIRRNGGDPFVAPAVREAPLGDGGEISRFAERLFAGAFDMMILLTGVGTRQLNRALAAQRGETAFADALNRLAAIARGPKPAAALREMGVTPAGIAPEPHTWREVLRVVQDRPEKRIAVQEYGRPNPELMAALRDGGADVASVRIYQYALPEDPGPLREAARWLGAGRFEMALFTAAAQIGLLMQIARDLGIEDAVLRGLRAASIGSIGPTTSEALEEFGLHPDFEPSHPKMGIFVREAAERAGG